MARYFFYYAFMAGYLMFLAYMCERYGIPYVVVAVFAIPAFAIIASFMRTPYDPDVVG